MITVMAAVIIFRDALQPDPPVTADLSDGITQIEFLQVGLGSLKYSSDNSFQAMLRKQLPGNLSRKLGPEITVTTNGLVAANGQPELLMLFRLTPRGGTAKLPKDVERCIGRTEFLESTGYVFSELNSGYSSYSNGLISIGRSMFPGRDPTLHFRIFEKDTDRLLFDHSVPNPAYESSYPVWKPEPLPASKTDGPITVDVQSLEPDEQRRLVTAHLTTSTSDPARERRHHSYRYEDSTGNLGASLSPFEPAWKLLVEVRRAEDAVFSSEEVWDLGPMPLPQAETFQELKLERLIGDLPFYARYLSSAGAIREEAGTTTIHPPSYPGIASFNISRRTSFENRQTREYTDFDSGLPFFLIQLPDLSGDAGLIRFVHDQDGRRLDWPGSSTYGYGGVSLTAVQFTPHADTKTVHLKLIVNRSKRFEFLVSPPDSMRENVRHQQVREQTQK